MEKIFKTIDEQIEILKSRSIIIDDYEKVYKLLSKNNYYYLINGYKNLFIDNTSKEEIKEIIEKSNSLICQQSMEKFITPDLNELYYKNEKYYEQLEMIVNYSQTLYKILKELKKENDEHIDSSLILQN